jgi:aminoglycoside phosphotransferase (APT) family kinase protein
VDEKPQLPVDALAQKLAAVVQRVIADTASIENLAQLSGGASQQTWSFDAVAPGTRRALILRLGPPGYKPSDDAPGLEKEAELMRLAAARGVPSPHVLHILQASDGIGRGFIMDRVDGETIPRKILRDPQFAAVRPKLARQVGGILARIHSIDVATLPALPLKSAASQLSDLRQVYENDGQPRPVFELAFRWLQERMPPPLPSHRLVHGDFRHGNLIIGPDGVRAVLDWEIAHVGDPFCDLGWICVNSWRFGVIDQPVGGFGQLQDLIEGYEEAGGDRVDVQRVKFWEAFGTLRWGVFCLKLFARCANPQTRSVEYAMIGRRVSETEIDLLRLIAPRRA